MTTVWQNIPSIFNSLIHENHHYVKMAPYFIIGYKIKKTSELEVCVINSSSWPNMSTGDPVVSSEWFWLMKALNEWHSAWPEDKTFPIKIHNIQILNATKNTKQRPESHNPHLTFSTIQRDEVCLHHWPVDTHNKQKIHCASVSCLNRDHKAQGNKMIFPFFSFLNRYKHDWSESKQQCYRLNSLPAV